MALIGDRHQLPAVGRGGVLDLAIRYAPDRVTQLDTIRRFTDPAYAELSLRMRSGNRPGEVFDELVRRGDVVVHASEVERQDVLAVKASRGQLVVADTREQVTGINHTAHRVRVITGEATDCIVTAAGERIGTGDTITTRRNDTDLDVANRETGPSSTPPRTDWSSPARTGGVCFRRPTSTHTPNSPTRPPRMAPKAQRSPPPTCSSGTTPALQRRTSA